MFEQISHFVEYLENNLKIITIHLLIVSVLTGGF